MSNRVPELERLLNAPFQRYFSRRSSFSLKKRPRDTQKWKLYRAEREAFASLPENPREATAREITQFLHALKPYGGLRVVLKARGHISTAQPATGLIRIAPCHLANRWVWVHERAHLDVSDGVASHGREFAAAYLDLVGKAFGASWRDRLRDCFDRAGVKWRAPKEISPERRAALVAQGKRLAALRHAKLHPAQPEVPRVRAQALAIAWAHAQAGEATS